MDKPAGPTSHDIVELARRRMGEGRIGHTGTLDPFASGLLLLCVGSATRLAEYLSGLPKTYTATARLGVTTDTLDPEGTVVRTSDAWRALPPAAIRSAFEAQAGERMQRPPAYSAKRVGGERLYAKARRGEEVQVGEVPVVIHAIAVLECDPPDVVFALTCSSGTYVRAIARDVGDALGVGAHLTALRRTAIGSHRLQGALAPDELADADRVAAALLSPLDALAHLPRAELGATDVRAVTEGRAIEIGAAALRLVRPSSAAPPEPYVGALGQAAHLAPGAAAVYGPVPGASRAPAAVPAADAGGTETIALAAGDVLIAVAEWRDGRARPRKVFRAR